MYKLAYEKCICFIFLVILAILSCSGFRIDNLAMTDISKKNFHTSNSFSIERIFDSSAVEKPPHRIRHQRLRRSQLHHTSTTSDIFPFHKQFFPPPREDIFFPPTSDSVAQIPATSRHHPLFPTKPIVSRTQRSSSNSYKQKRRRQQQSEDITVKAYKADIVLLAETVGRNSSSDNQWVFKVNHTYKDVKHLSKNQFVLEVNFEKGKSRSRSKLDFGQKYLLFLNASSPNRFWSVAPPKKIKNAVSNQMLRVCKPNFVPTPPRILELKEITRKDNRNKRRLFCKVGGLPVPKIHWKRNGSILPQNNKLFRIQYKRRESTLTIRKINAESMGQYACVVEGVDGREATRSISIKLSQTPREECDESMKVYCQNGGTCRREESMQEFYCICPPGFGGSQCEKKVPTNASMYPQPAIYTCKVGLSTKLYC